MATSGSFTTSGYSISGDTVALVFSWTRTAYSVANNTSTISWTLTGKRSKSGYVKAGGFKVVIDGSTVYSKSTDYRIELYNGTVVASGTKVITHNSNGSRSFTASAEGGIYNYAVNCSGSSSFTLNTIPRASTFTTASSGTLGVAQAFTLTKYDSSFTHTVTYVCGNSGTVTVWNKVQGTGTTITFPVTLAAQNTAGTSVSVKLTLQTFDSSGNLVGSAVTKTVAMAIPSSVKPSCGLEVSDALGYAGYYGAYIKGLSRLAVTVTPELAYGSPIAAYTTTANGNTYTSAQFTTGVLKTFGALTVQTQVRDKRGRYSSSVSKSITVWDYAAPQVTALTVKRCNSNGAENAQGAYVQVTFSATVSALNNMNEATYILSYKKSDAAEWESSAALDDIHNNYAVSNYTYIFAADTGSSYDVEVQLEDRHIGVTKATSASTAFALMHFSADGTSIGFGKVVERSNAIELGLSLYDKFNTLIGNGLAAYTGSGDAAIDPDTTAEHLILTDKNTPVSNTFFYIETKFYNTKSGNRAQTAAPYNAVSSMYRRYYYNNAWSEWTRLVNESELDLTTARATPTSSDYSGSLSLYKQGPWIYCRGSIAITPATDKDTVRQLLTLPADYCPASTTYLTLTARYSSLNWITVQGIVYGTAAASNACVFAVRSKEYGALSGNCTVYLAETWLAGY